MLRDVKTRWNSTFVMLDFAIMYRKALDLLSGERGNGLREFELKEDEWKMVVQLCDVLKVTVFGLSLQFLSDFSHRSFKRRQLSSRGGCPISPQ
jgi:hypothetical protein